MPLYHYKCFVCGKTEEKILPVGRRTEQFPCQAINTLSKEDLIKCPGKLIFQPIASMKGGTFRMHDPTEREAQG